MLRRPWETCIVIVAVLMTLALLVAALAVDGKYEHSRVDRAVLDLRSIQGALELFWPGTARRK
jgi:hypothetical protein